MTEGSISIVMPTYNRAKALRATLPDLLLVEGVAEIVVVDDGSSDDTLAVLAEARDPRLRTVLHETQRGAPAARNTGVDASTGDWILFGEDDCVLPRDAALVLRAEAKRHGADIVSGPWLNVARDDRQRALDSGRQHAVEKIELDTHPSTFPRAAVRTPFLPAPALIRRVVFDDVRFDAIYRGNAWREETDFFVSAARRGYVFVLTPATVSFQVAQWSGGQRRSRLRYEYWVWRNNRLFLRRHGEWLREHGHIRSPLASSLESIAARFRAVVGGKLRALLEGPR
jgi:glycosyltransferase involved in cell wall biosynthesis